MTGVDVRLEQLRLRFLARCQADLVNIRNPSLPMEDLQKIAHRIAGMAGTVGLGTLGDAAFALDQEFRHGKEGHAAQRVLAERFADALEITLERHSPKA
ncbi:Hpt domain-containing protein [Sphingobium sp. TCM1]|uniref:Hpt domain-containing protein n=1 Tax=Sphingobium sp. TCM1 TaxID=453246 RepID=UPI0007F33451|nr:Hpt domain-containing protein [Sphingobium sp. TCM1]OAN56550.1 hypothetical protein A7Q26_18365 [Sphingobium sp. TCM1]